MVQNLISLIRQILNTLFNRILRVDSVLSDSINST
jgi:hypothetical protein